MGTQASVSGVLASVPPNVPSDRVMNIDMYNPDGIAEGYHEAWKRPQAPGTPDLVWAPSNGGHWIATRGAGIRDIYNDPERFSSHVIFLPKEAGEKYAMIRPSGSTPAEMAVAEARMVAKDVIPDGVNLKHGDMVLIPTALHGLDERVNEGPMEVNFHRARIQHSTFGGGPLRCAGMHLARMEVTVTFQEWLSRMGSVRSPSPARWP